MKRFIKFALPIFAACLLSGCLPASPSNTAPGSASTQPAATLTGVGAVASVSPAFTPTPGSLATVSTPTATPVGPTIAEKAMRRDIDALIARSDDQRGQEENYKNLKKTQLITVESVTDKKLKFKDKPQVFEGDYTGQFTPGKSYPYFEDADMGGKRYYNVKDNFGVWVIFKYTVPI